VNPLRRGAAIAALVAALFPACSGGGGKGRETLTVLGAASLTEAFQSIGDAFERANGGVRVRFSFGPSDGLAQQIRNGAGADVFASASGTWMDAVADDPGISHRSDFARNRLTLVVPSSNPAGIARLGDLTRPGVKLVLAAQGVPAGDYAREILDNAGIAKAALANLVSNEIDVKGVLAKVASGDADAGIVYVTDLTPDVAARVDTRPIPDSVNVVATYPIGVVDGAADPGMAYRFVRFVLGPGQRMLRDAGFLPAT
jgi:molybdate transport system substrate-binding protein